MASSCPRHSRMSVRDATSQICTWPKRAGAPPAAASHRPSGLKASARTTSLCPASVAMVFPATSASVVWWKLPTAVVLPSGESAMAAMRRSGASIVSVIEDELLAGKQRPRHVFEGLSSLIGQPRERAEQGVALAIAGTPRERQQVKMVDDLAVGESQPDHLSDARI